MLARSYINRQVKTALKEDLGKLGDITSKALIQKNQKSVAIIKLKENAVLCGLELAVATFKTIDNKIKIVSKKTDGRKFKKGTVVLKIKGSTRSILIAERTALNFLGLMSGIATKSKIYADIARPYGVKIYSTRKTIVGIRDLEKYALTKGGAHINRMSLDDFFFIKDNHLKSFINLKDSIAKVRKYNPRKKITVEVDNISQLRKILNEKIDVILLDNMNSDRIKKCLKLAKKRFVCEASGNINLKNLRAIARTKVNRISTGQLTHSIKNVDFGLEI